MLLEKVIAVSTGAVVALGLVSWASGELSGFLSHHHWPKVPARQAPIIGIHVLAHLAHPANAWPPNQRMQLGPAPLLTIMLLFTAGAALAAGLLVARTAHQLFANPRIPALPGLATAAELRRELSATARRRAHQHQRAARNRGCQLP
jgi:hypothetical protein